MGSAVEALAPGRGHCVVTRFNSGRTLAGVTGLEELSGADVAIDFSQPAVVLEHLKRYACWRLPAVVGTTGWYGALPEVAAWVAENRAALLYAPNFSLGIQIMLHALRTAGALLDRLADYDMAVHEIHHAGKIDRPSGTALLLAKTLLGSVSRKTQISVEGAHALEVTSTRIGAVVGEHTVRMESPADCIIFTHQSKSREGFALGALRAAEWLQGRSGLFTFEHVLMDWLREEQHTGPTSP